MAKILVIEDDTQFCQMLAQMLIQAGHEVETALNGVLGLERFRQSIPDLVITDIMMPEKDGIDVIVDIKRQKRGGQDYRDLWWTASDYPQFNLDSAALIGAVQVLAKPFNREQLLAAIAAALE